MMELKQIAESLARELGASHQVLSSYVVKQTPQRTMPLLQLIELYIKVKGEQAFIKNYLDQDSLYKEHGGFLQRSADSAGNTWISFVQSVIAFGQI